MAKTIYVTRETRQELRRAFKCRRETIWNALNFKTDSELAQRIRKLAVTKGGVTYDPDLRQNSDRRRTTG